jgi:hypothetical protein
MNSSVEIRANFREKVQEKERESVSATKDMRVSDAAIVMLIILQPKRMRRRFYVKVRFWTYKLNGNKGLCSNSVMSIFLIYKSI